jgi:hypothetical protein
MTGASANFIPGTHHAAFAASNAHNPVAHS